MKDCLYKLFQQNTIKIWNERKGRSEISSKSSKGIEYLKALLTCCNGFSATTTCGYTILENGGDDCNNIDFNATFSLVEIGISVRIDQMIFIIPFLHRHSRTVHQYPL